jgi:hypothetical protein
MITNTSKEAWQSEANLVTINKNPKNNSMPTTSATVLSNNIIHINNSKPYSSGLLLESYTDVELIKKQSSLSSSSYQRKQNRKLTKQTPIVSVVQAKENDPIFKSKKKKKSNNNKKSKMHQQTEIFSSIFKLFSRNKTATKAIKSQNNDASSSLYIQVPPTPLKASSVASSSSSSSSSTSSSSSSSSSTSMSSLKLFSNSSAKSNSLRTNQISKRNYSKSISKCFKSIQVKY